VRGGGGYLGSEVVSIILQLLDGGGQAAQLLAGVGLGLLPCVGGRGAAVAGVGTGIVGGRGGHQVVLRPLKQQAFKEAVRDRRLGELPCIA